MKVSRRDFLKLSTMACAWLFTGCTTNEKAILLGTAGSDSDSGLTIGDGGTPSGEQPPTGSGKLRDGIVIPAGFELPLEGATGFVGAASLALYSQASDSSSVLRTLGVGDMFYIRQESGQYWQVCVVDGTVGWVRSTYCMINLPDVLPSVIYEDPNAVAAVFVTCGERIEGITDFKLYDGLYYNPRLGRSEFVMPINYNMAKKVAAIQKTALAAGDCLKIIETFRPYNVQMQVAEAVRKKASANKAIRDALNEGSWNIGWFIATSLSNHQRGVAMDTTLVHITDTKEQSIGGCSFVRVTGDEYQMPSVMHELSSAAACFTKPVNSSSKTAWRSATSASSMTEGAFLLQKYCTDADLTPLASEWWHFNDLDAQKVVSGNSGRGKFYMEGCLSWKMFEA